MWFKKKCGHWGAYTNFVDLHTGGEGEIYIRFQIRCPKCGLKILHAVRLPEWVDVAIDRNKIDWHKNNGMELINK